MNIPESILKPFGYTGMPIITTESLGYALLNKQMEEAVSTTWEDGPCYAPYIPMQISKVWDDGKWVNFEVGMNDEDSPDIN